MRFFVCLVYIVYMLEFVFVKTMYVLLLYVSMQNNTVVMTGDWNKMRPFHSLPPIIMDVFFIYYECMHLCLLISQLFCQ